MYDVAIVGAGAGGLASALRIKQLNPELNVVLLEKLDRVGKKLIITGNGRCNITNKYASLNDYHTENPEILKRVFDRYFVKDTVEFFEKIGTQIVFETDGKGYPASFQASGVVDSLRFALDETGVKVITDFAVTDISFGETIVIKNKNEKISAKSVILCAGLFSGTDKLGCDGSVLKILKNKGLKIVEASPSIVQIKTENSVTRQLKGIKVNAKATIHTEKGDRSEYGEVLFTDYGLSGPPILQISRLTREEGKKTVTLDLLPDYDFDGLYNTLLKRRENLKMRKNENFLVGFVNKRLGQIILKIAKIDLQKSAEALSNEDINRIAFNLKNFVFSVTGNTGYINSQVTAGGISLTEIGADMQSKKLNGVFLCGEILDVDGDCGGYNLQWAWSSAFCAAQGVLDYLGE